MAHPTSDRARARLRPVLTGAVIVAGLLLGLAVAVPVGAVPADAGFMDHSYNASSVTTPTQDKPQSKVWYTDGFWWAAMFNVDAAATHIYRYDAGAHTWSDTGTEIDDRNSSHGDYLWDAAANALYVASVNGDTDADPILVFKLNYNATLNTYAHDADFGTNGVQVGTGPSETVTIAKDSTGQLWVTFTNPVDPTGLTTTNRQVMINRSTGPEDVFGSAFALSGLQVAADDISAIVAFGGNSVGVMWSNQLDPGNATTRFSFSTHADNAADTTWSAASTVFSGDDEFAEDHINLKLAATGSGQVLAAVKTNDGPDHIQLVSRNSNGTWTPHLVVENEDVSRPQVVIDDTNDRAYVFYTSPESASDPLTDMTVYYKSAPLSTLDFAEGGLGTTFIADLGVDIMDVSTAKHPVTASMGGILAIASGDTNETYYHGWIPLSAPSTPTPAPTPPGPTPTPTPTPTPDPSGHPFTDIDSSQFENSIIWAWENGITAGCSPTLYCPNGLVTRGQMATFLSRALSLPATATDFFSDDNGSVHEDNINKVAAAGITTGCGGSSFCPNGLVTRAQMATFLSRAYDLAATATDYFTDDEGSVHENNINRIRSAGITTGCGGTNYCPNGLVTRGQMAAFLSRAEALD